MMSTGANAYQYPDHVDILVRGCTTSLPIRSREPGERRAHWDSYLTGTLKDAGWSLNAWHSPLGRGPVPWQLTAFIWAGE